MGLSGISGFGAIESGCRWVQGSFSTANVLVNLLVKEAVEGLSTLLTGYLSRLVSGLERGLLHRSVTHCWSALYRTWAAVNLLLSEYGRIDPVSGCYQRHSEVRKCAVRDSSRPRGPRKFMISCRELLSNSVSRNRFYDCFQNGFQKPLPRTDSKKWSQIACFDS